MHRRYYSLGDFRLESGVVLPNATIAYATLGTLNRDKSNVVLAPSWFGSDHHGYDFPIGDGRALDPATYFIVATEMLSSGFGSSPSNTPEPFHGPRFPAIAIRDNVEAARRVLESLGVTDVRAIIGFSMGAEQAFQWAVSHPAFADRIVAYCGTAKPMMAEQVVNQTIAALSARDANDCIAQARTWQRHDVGDTPGFGGDVEAALRDTERAPAETRSTTCS